MGLTLSCDHGGGCTALMGVHFRTDMLGYNRVSQRNEVSIELRHGLLPRCLSSQKVYDMIAAPQDAKLTLQEIFSSQKASGKGCDFDAHVKHHHTLLIGEWDPIGIHPLSTSSLNLCCLTLLIHLFRRS